MKKIYSLKIYFFFCVTLVLLFVMSCKKPGAENGNGSSTSGIVTATPARLGLYEVDSSVYKQFLIPVASIGTITSGFYPVFDTGSGGLVIDAAGLLPPAMITNSGFNFTGDSIVVNGITITNQTSTITYGDNCSTSNDTVYGNLAYAQVTVGDPNGNITIKHMPFFIYYKATNGAGNLYPANYFDVFGVNQEYDFSFPNVNVTSPFSYFDPGTGLTQGFKTAPLGGPYVYDSNAGANYAPGVVTVGLTSSDVSSTSGFVNTQLSLYSGYGYVPLIPSTVTYNSKSFNSYVVFDSGTAGYSYLEDPSFTGSATALAQNSQVSIATTSGFSYSYAVTATDNETNVENPATSCETVSILSIEYFLSNEYMINYSNHNLGLKLK